MLDGILFFLHKNTTIFLFEHLLIGNIIYND
jgi:hypothetical protein